ncbi:MAG: T9SS type A sorting domain-containing protein [Bacteroidia bacterium]|nr:T9SS type A sorting domain-containing protein [Bacteroidia bacterium]
MLGSAGPRYSIRNFAEAPERDVFYPAALANALAGRDLEANLPDIVARFNQNRADWYFGLDGNPPPGAFDFVTVVLHELGHGMGFIGTGEVTLSEGSVGNDDGVPLIFDFFVQNGSGVAITSFPSPSSQLRQQLEGNNLFFGGNNTIEANLGVAPRIYAPNPWDDGSSYSHWDEQAFPSRNINSLMTPQLARREVIQDIGDITRGMMQDMGWTLNTGANVIITNFRAQRANPSDVLLRWSTILERENQGFVIEKAPIGSSFVAVGFIAGNNDATALVNYEFTDRFAPDEALYRLRQVSLDESFNLTDSVLVAGNGLNSLRIFNNPAINTVRYVLGEGRSANEPVTLAVFDTRGREMMSLSRTLVSNEIFIRDWTPGVYILRVQTATEVFVERFLKY